MLRVIPLFLIMAVLLPVLAMAQTEERLTDPKPGEFQFIGYAFLRTTSSNIAPTSDVLQGQVIGRLFGSNSTNTGFSPGFYTEQRFVPMMIYKPDILDGYATFRTLFKIDWTWGDQSYGVGNNRGGGLSGGQVNLQTLMANIDIRPPDANWNLVIGMQRLFDGVRDPNINTLDLFQTTGYKLSFWGTQAVGINWFAKPHPAIDTRLGFFQLWENLIASDDDVFLLMGDILTRPTPKLELGFNLWYLRDTGKGGGGISVLGQGLTSALSEYNGSVRIRLPGQSQLYKADIFWTGVNLAWNRDFVHGPLSFDAYAIANLGRIDSLAAPGGKVADVIGGAFNSTIAWKYGMTNRDKIWLETIFSTGDENGVQDGTLNSVLTGNVWGSPVGIYSSHRAFLLFPDPQVVNRYYSMVHDISNMGLGVAGLTVNAMRDFIPNRFSGKIGAAVAFSNYSLPDGGNYIGSEINAEFKYNLRVFLTVGLSGAYAMVGDFYDAPRATTDRIKPENPWTAFLSLTWLMF
jgi:hypothetical protein